MRKSAISLLSGGLDSAAATLLAGKKHKIRLALTFDYGQRAAKKEIAAARAFCKKYKIKHKVIRIDWLRSVSSSALTDKKRILPKFHDNNFIADLNKCKKSARSVWVPNRNALFANIAAAFAEAMNCKYIIAGFNAEESRTFPDNSPEFVLKSNNLFLKSTLSHPKIISPVQKMNKTQIAKSAVKLKINPRFFWSCYDGGARMCGTCESCARMINAFKKACAWELVSKRFKGI
jgi:7-cyano-7-deazaguanine synthase